MDATFRKIGLNPFESVYGKIYWYSWSKEFLRFYKEFKNSVDVSKLKPDLIFIDGFNDYNYSYNLDFKKYVPIKFRCDFKKFSLNFLEYPLQNRILFFTNLINPQILGGDIHLIFSIFSNVIAYEHKYEMGALYPPLTISNNGHFPLHCDLYIPQILFNLFDEVPQNNTGASLFLRIDTLLYDILPTISKMPEKIKEQISSIIASNDNIDRYEKFYDLLNNTGHPWFYQLKRQTDARRFSIKFEKGQGYMLNDRKWLHGRTKPSKILTEKRVHRLTFNFRQDREVN